MQINGNTREKVFVVFMAHSVDDRNTLFQKLFVWCLNHMRKNFSHVAIFKKSRIAGNIIEINCCSDNYVVRECDEEDFWNFITRPDITALAVEVHTGAIKAKGLITCVSTAKHYLGIDKPFIITPYQLYKFLEDKHGRKV